jgi:uncharacterized membrane protein YkoI
VNSGAAVTAIENIASVMTLVANLFMHFSWFPYWRSTRGCHGIEPPTVSNIPGFSRLFLEDTVPTSAQLAGYNMARQHNQIVMQMNEVRHFASECIQRRVPNVVSMIDEPGCSAGDPEIPFEQEMSMLKTISAALLAVSVLAAPALAAQSGKTTANAPVVKTTKATQVKSTQVKSTHAKITRGAATTQVTPSALNANAKMDKHHHRKHYSHYRHHGKMAAMKTIQPKAHAKTAPKVSLKPAASTTRRG